MAGGTHSSMHSENRTWEGVFHADHRQFSDRLEYNVLDLDSKCKTVLSLRKAARDWAGATKVCRIASSAAGLSGTTAGHVELVGGGPSLPGADGSSVQD